MRTTKADIEIQHPIISDRNSESTPCRRYGHRLRTPFLRTTLLDYKIWSELQRTLVLGAPRASRPQKFQKKNSKQGQKPEENSGINYFEPLSDCLDPGLSAQESLFRLLPDFGSKGPTDSCKCPTLFFKTRMYSVEELASKSYMSALQILGTH